MKRKSLFCTLYFLLGLVFINCQREEECPPFSGAYFDINGIQSALHHHSIGESASPPLPHNSTVTFEKYRGIILRYSTDYLADVYPLGPVKGGFSELRALSCIPNGEAGSKNEKYKEITITTQYNFNDNYSAGDTINDMITIGFNETIEEFILNRDTINIEYDYLWFTISEPPTADTRFKVLINIVLDNGETYQKESTKVRFI